MAALPPELEDYVEKPEDESQPPAPPRAGQREHALRLDLGKRQSLQG